MKLLTIKVLTILSLFVLINEVSWAKEVNNHPDQDCPNIKLLKNTSIEESYATSNGKKEPLYMSGNYCFIYYEQRNFGGMESALIHYSDARFWLSKREAKNISKSYRKAYADLRNQEQKLTFIHLFLVKLTRQFLVTPYAFEARRADIILFSTIKPVSHKSHIIKLATDMPDAEVLATLNAMQANPPKAEDHPYLSQLVDAVLDKKAVISDDKLFELASMM